MHEVTAGAFEALLKSISSEAMDRNITTSQICSICCNIACTI